MDGALYETAFAALRERLSDRAFAHCERVAQTAGELAEAYGVDPESARLAGLLHDWDREVGDEGLLAAALEDDIDTTDTDRTLPYLLHARTGARGVAREFPDITAEVLQAIESHTVGAHEMAELDMVIYMADMIEPARSFQGVDELRELVGATSLRELYMRGYQHTLLHLIERKRPLHINTVKAWNALVSGGVR